MPPQKKRAYLSKKHLSGFRDHKNQIDEISGRRVVAFKSLMKFISFTNRHAKQCKMYHLKFIKEVKNGLDSKMRWQCSCGCKIEIDSDDEQLSLPVNQAFVWGCQNSAVGYDSVSNVIAAMDLQAPCKNTFQKLKDEYHVSMEKALQKEYQEAGAKERELAEEAGDFVKVNGMQYPAITVIVDGGWCKRSYGHSYNANNGVAVIIGKRTGKVIYMGTRTKSCHVCKVNENKELKIDHDCYKNWDGSSTAMETSILKEGFATSIQMHGLVYNMFIGDGDSSVFAGVKGSYEGIEVQKIECINHAVRNYNTKLLAISKNTVKGKNAPNIPKEDRQLLNKHYHRFGASIVAAATFYQDKKTNESWKELRADLINVPYHIFGQHDKCKPYFCTRKDEPIEENKLAEAMKCNFWAPLMQAHNRIVNLAKSLVEKQTSNAAENFMSVANKFQEGKRIYLGQKNLYIIRMSAAVFAYNHSRFWISDMFKSVFDAEPSDLWQAKTERAVIERNLAKLRQKKSKKARIIKFHQVADAKGDKDYGTHPEKPDLDDDVLSLAIDDLKTSLMVTKASQEAIAEMSKQQADSDEWFAQRRQRITASIAGKIFKLRKDSDTNSILNTKLNGNFYGGVVKAALAYGSENEKNAIAVYESVCNNPDRVKPCGFYVSIENGIFGASPDGLIGDYGIIEVKCPYSMRDGIPEDWPAKSGSSLKIVNGELKLKTNHEHYYQCVMQLHVTERLWCDYIVWTPKGHYLERVERGPETVKVWNALKLKLEEFWMRELAPELVDSRKDRGYKYKYSKERLAAMIAKKAKSDLKKEPIISFISSPPSKRSKLS